HGGALAQLPQSETHAHGALGVALDRSETHELVDEAVRRRHWQFRRPREFRHADRLPLRRQRMQQPGGALQQRDARFPRPARHGYTSSWCLASSRYSGVDATSSEWVPTPTTSPWSRTTMWSESTTVLRR